MMRHAMSHRRRAGVPFTRRTRYDNEVEAH